MAFRDSLVLGAVLPLFLYTVPASAQDTPAATPAEPTPEAAPAEPPAPTVTVEEEPAAPPRATTIVYVTGGAAIVAALIGGGLGISAIEAASDFKSAPSTALYDRGSQTAFAADVFFGIALTLAVTSVTLFFVKPVTTKKKRIETTAIAF
jgi:hypothetical protein